MRTMPFLALLALLLVVFAPGFAAAAGAAEKPVPIEPPADLSLPGQDWRARRGYYGGAINESAGVHVLYFLFDNGKLAFFLDDASRVSLLTVDMAPWPDPQDAVDRIVFEDVNSDGYNDLKIPVSPGTFRVWLWLPEQGTFDGTARDGVKN